MGMIKYTCGKCGGEIRQICLTSYPPQYRAECTECGATRTWSDKIKEVPLYMGDSLKHGRG